MDNRLPYLDVLVISKNNGEIITQWYHKSISSGRILNFNSHHPISQRISTAYGLIFRIKKLTTDLNFNADLIIYEYLKNNNYPKNIISKLIAKFNSTLLPTYNSGSHNEVVYRSLTYTKGISEQINFALKQHLVNTRIMYRVNNTISKFFTNLKDKIENKDICNVVYSIPCGECDQKYIGTTSQKLCKRISGHKSTSKFPILNPHVSSLAQHSHDTGHKFKFEETTILLKENNWRKRLFLEMIQIHKHKDSAVNKKTDIEGLSQIYSWILEKISRLNS